MTISKQNPKETNLSGKDIFCKKVLANKRAYQTGKAIVTNTNMGNKYTVTLSSHLSRRLFVVCEAPNTVKDSGPTSWHQ